MADAPLFTSDDVKLCRLEAQMYTDSNIAPFTSLADRLQAWLDEQALEAKESRRRKFLEDRLNAAHAEWLAQESA